MPKAKARLFVDEVLTVGFVEQGDDPDAELVFFKTFEKQTKREAGADFPARAFAFVPDATSPSTWKLRLWEEPGVGPTAAQVGRAVAALGPGGFRGNRVQIPSSDLAGVKRKVLKAWLATHPDDTRADAPDVLKALHDHRIEMRGGRHVLFAPDGSVLGTHETEEEARRQLSGIVALSTRKQKMTNPVMNFLKALAAKVGMGKEEVDKLLADEGATGDGSDGGDGAANGGDMDFDVSKLGAEAKEAVEKLQAQIKTVTGERDTLQKTVDAAGDGGDNDDVLKDASPALRALLEKTQAEAKEAKEEAAEASKIAKGLKDAEESQRFFKIVQKSMTHLPEASPDDFGPILRKCAEGLDDEEFKKLQTILSAASAQIQEGLLLKRMGAGGRAATSVDAEITEKVEAVQKDNPEMSAQHVRGKVFKDNPQLRRKYEDEIAALNGEG